MGEIRKKIFGIPNKMGDKIYYCIKVSDLITELEEREKKELKEVEKAKQWATPFAIWHQGMVDWIKQFKEELKQEHMKDLK